MFIQRLFSPKWKHKNPAVRKEALEALNPKKEDTQKIFAEVLRIDPDLSIRRLVVGRLCDVELLRQLLKTQDELADSANKRIRQLIAGTAQYPIDLPIRKQSFTAIDDQEVVEYVARESKDAEMRLMAVEKIQRQSLLGDLAADDADQGVRLKALDKITQISTLDRVYKKSRLRDKRVSALAKERLDALTAEEERPKVLKKEAKQCFLDLETLVQRCKKNGQWLSAKPRFDALQNTWQSTQEQWQNRFGQWDEGLTASFNELSAQFQQRFQIKQQEEAEKRAQEEKAEPYKAQKRKVCEDLEARLAELKQLTSPEVSQLEQLTAFLSANQQLWDSAQQSLLAEQASGNANMGQEHEAIDHHFQQLVANINEYKNDLRLHLDYHQKLNRLKEKAATLLAGEDFVEPGAVSEIQKACDKLAVPKYYPADNALASQVKQTLADLSQRLQVQQEQRQANLDEFIVLVEELSGALKAGKSKHAVNLANRGRKLLTMFAQNDRRALQKNNTIKRFNESLKQLSDLQSWRQWSSAPVKEQLVAQMQQLAQQVSDNKDNEEFDFQDAAQQVKDARAQWKKLTAAEPNSSTELWEAFDTACTQAYEPCQEHFNKLSEVRGENLKKRQAACIALEEYLQVVSYKPTDLVDWKALDKIVRVAEEEWRGLGAVERTERTAINKRFRTVINALRQLHVDQKSRNKEEKELLIKRAEGVAKQLQEDKVSLRDAIESVKQLQLEWKTIGLAARDGDLWKQFRTQCDLVFQRREQESAAVREERQKTMDSRAAICEAIENLARLEGDTLKAAQKDFDDLKQQWSALPAMTKPGSLEKRYKNACAGFDAQNARRIQAEQDQRVNVQRQQAQLCLNAEEILWHCVQQPSSMEQCQEEFAQLDVHWRQLPEYSNSAAKALQRRFETIHNLLKKAAVAGIDSVVQDIHEQESTRKAEKELLCLQMEVLANIESPADAKQARMEYQVSQLAEKMKQATTGNIISEFEELQARWHLSGVVSWPLSQSLESRFERARRAIDQVG